jgi:hypothetical protein
MIHPARVSSVSFPQLGGNYAFGTGITSGRVYLWGTLAYNDYAPLGFSNQHPTELPGGATGIVETAAAYNTVCGRRIDGVVLCWGYVEGYPGEFEDFADHPIGIPSP